MRLLVSHRTAKSACQGFFGSNTWFLANHGQPAPYPSLAVRARNGRVADQPSGNRRMRCAPNERRNPCQFQLENSVTTCTRKPAIRQSGLNRLKCGSRLVHPPLELNAVPEPYMAVTVTIGLPRACQRAYTSRPPRRCLGPETVLRWPSVG